MISIFFYWLSYFIYLIILTSVITCFIIFAMNSYEPTTACMQRLKNQMSLSQWNRRVSQAIYRLRIIEAIQERYGKLSRAAARYAAPKEDWTNIRRWWKWYETREGEPWERLTDRREPGTSRKIPESWEMVIQALYRQGPGIKCSQIRDILVAQFGTSANMSDSAIQRILSKAGLNICQDGEEDKVVELSGGGGLVLLLGALIETRIIRRMAEDVTAFVGIQQAPDELPQKDPAGRNRQGEFTSEYNRNRHEMLKKEEKTLFQSIYEQRSVKNLKHLRIASMSVMTLENRLCCITALPLITDRQGTVGLDGPAGAWMEVLCPVAYRAKTAEMTLNDLKWLGAASTMWESHALTWLSWSKKWAGESWRQLVYYVDATQDAWWTRRFAKSAKVSSTGRVQPCLSRTVLSAGPGVPIIGEIVSGQAELAQRIFLMLDKADRILGEDMIGRITVVDAECCQLEILRCYAEDSKRDIITVLKGNPASGKILEDCGEWLPFRNKDQVREGKVNLEPKKKKSGLKLRVVEMKRQFTRHSKPTWFVTTVKREVLCTKAVAEAYLGRWPFQEDIFRRGRNGAGMERTHGYGVSKVTNVALIGKLEKATRKAESAEAKFGQAESSEKKAALQLSEAWKRLREKKKLSSENLNRRHELGIRQAKQRVKEAGIKLREAACQQKKALKELNALQSKPEDIYVRDTELDSIATCLKMTLPALPEFICQEYLGQRRIMPRTYIESWIALPVTVRQNQHQIIYSVAPNPRSPEMTELLGKALDQITRRKLRSGDLLLIAHIRDKPVLTEQSD